MKPLISITIPIFNVKEYIKDCIESVLGQSYKNIEVILVNDGSTDSSGEICNYYSRLDGRVRVFHQGNNGVSSARNKGIKNAKGEYLAFVDPDDTIEPTLYEELVETLLRFNADMVVCPIRTINLATNTTSVSSTLEPNVLITSKEIEEKIIPAILENETYSLVSSVNKLYKKELFYNNQILFDESKLHSEDAKLNFSHLQYINSLVFLEKPLYNYYQRCRGSLTKAFIPELYTYILDNKNSLLQLAKKYNCTEQIEAVVNHFTEVTLLHIQDIINNKVITREKKYSLILSILEDENFIKELNKYKSQSLFFSILKYLCIRKKVEESLILVTIKSFITNFLREIHLKN
ncbi:glycosyl transferase family protein [Mycobacteroides abscessus subsp. abscessus]|nr:glycosyl transferase family protein [Mycobacteroides abscessus subsp. abscessus]